jgi:hypothetical protein
MSRTSQTNPAKLPEINADTAVGLIGISLVRFHRIVKDGWIKQVGRNKYTIGDVVTGFFKFLEHECTRSKTAHELGRYLDISQRRVYDLIDAGVIERPKAGEGFDLDACRIGILRHQRKQLAGHGGGIGKLDLAAERAALAREQRETAALKNAITRGEYVRVKFVSDVITQHYSIVREHLLGVPGARGHDIATAALACANIQNATAVVTEKLREAIYEALTNLSNPENYEQWRAETNPHGWNGDDDAEQSRAADDNTLTSEDSK